MLYKTMTIKTKENTKYVVDTNLNNVNKTWAILQKAPNWR